MVETEKGDETEARQNGDELEGKSSNLTAFAYRETSNRLHTGRGRFGSSNRGRGGRGRGQSQNMGLVRVNPDDSKLQSVQHSCVEYDARMNDALPDTTCQESRRCPFVHSSNGTDSA